MASGLTLADQQRAFFFQVLEERFSDLVEMYGRLYPLRSYGATGWDWKGIALRLREFCEVHGISDRMPRPIIPGEKRTLNKRVVEALANECYRLELDNASQQRVWAYRKAAWAIEDTPQDLGLIYRAMGRKGLESIENVGPKMATVVERLIE